MKRYILPLRWRLTLAAVTLGLGWAAHVWPQSEARLLLTVLMITVLIAGARYRGAWWSDSRLALVTVTPMLVL